MQDFVGTAGHKNGFYVNDNNRLLKKYQAGSESEIHFLDTLSNTSDPIYKFVPKIYGEYEMDGTKFIEMDNLLLDVVQPSVMDIKVSKYFLYFYRQLMVRFDRFRFPL